MPTAANIPRRSLATEELRTSIELHCRCLASIDLMNLPIYIVWKIELPGTGYGTRCFGIFNRDLDLVARESIGDRWRGRGPAFMLDEDAIATVVSDVFVEPRLSMPHLNFDRRERSLFGEICTRVATHELAHVLEHRVTRNRKTRPVAREIASREVEQLQESTRVDRAAGGIPFKAHGWKFLRNLLHLAARSACVPPGRAMPLDSLFDAPHYQLSPIEEYAAAIGDEPERMREYSFAAIRATHPPAAFVDLWRRDFLRWMDGADPNSFDAASLREHFITNPESEVSCPS